MQGKNCIVSGANSGIGFETAKALAEKGAQVIMLCRNPEKAQEAKSLIQDATGNQAIDIFIADLASQEQIKAAAKAITTKYPVIDVLVNNAGTWISKFELTEDGIERVFAINHLSYFYLTHLLYPNLIKSENPRIVNVSSDSHFKGKLDFDDLYIEKNYHGLKSYANSKMGNVFFTYEFDRQKPHKNIAINAVQPGLVHTDIGLKHTTWLHAVAWKVRRTFWKSLTPAEGAATSIYLASSEDAKGQSGQYWDDCKPKPSSEDTYNEADAARLWEESMRLCGIKDYFMV